MFNQSNPANNLLLTFAIAQIRQFTQPYLPRDEADALQQIFFARLYDYGEQPLLESYLRSAGQEADPSENSSIQTQQADLTVDVHNWFLKRLMDHAHFLDIVRLTEPYQRLARLYLHYPDGLLRYQIIKVFYRFDENSAPQTRSSPQLRTIWSTLYDIRDRNDQPANDILWTEHFDVLIDISLQATTKAALSDVEGARNRTDYWALIALSKWLREETQSRYVFTLFRKRLMDREVDILDNP
jgi:hypothetical protein